MSFALKLLESHEYMSENYLYMLYKYALGGGGSVVSLNSLRPPRSHIGEVVIFLQALTVTLGLREHFNFNPFYPHIDKRLVKDELKVQYEERYLGDKAFKRLFDGTFDSSDIDEIGVLGVPDRLLRCTIFVRRSSSEKVLLMLAFYLDAYVGQFLTDELDRVQKQEYAQSYTVWNWSSHLDVALDVLKDKLNKHGDEFILTKSDFPDEKGFLFVHTIFGLAKSGYIKICDLGIDSETFLLSDEKKEAYMFHIKVLDLSPVSSKGVSLSGSNRLCIYKYAGDEICYQDGGFFLNKINKPFMYLQKGKLPERIWSLAASKQISKLMAHDMLDSGFDLNDVRVAVDNGHRKYLAKRIMNDCDVLDVVKLKEFVNAHLLRWDRGDLTLYDLEY